MAKVKDYYHILGVSESADEDEVKRAFAMLAKQHSSSDPAAKELKEAYDVLCNPRKRQQYDSYRAHQISTGQLEEVLANGSSSTNGNGNGVKKSLQRWEYLTLQSSSNYGTTKFYINGEMQPDLKNGVFSDIINTLGSDGWEMVGMTAVGSDVTYVFKRPTDKAFAPSKKGPAA